MTNLLRFAPFSDLDEMPGVQRLQDSVNRLFNDSGVRPWSPSVDIIETENELLLKMDIPDVQLENVQINLENQTLTVHGERKFEKQDGRNYHRIERSYGAFARAFTLPSTVDTEKVQAGYKAGVLTITVPKKELAKPRQIKIQANEQ